MTIVRTIVDLTCLPSSVGAQIGVMQIDVGLLVASQEEFAASVVSDPSNLGDKPISGWYWRHRMFCRDHTTSGAVTSEVRVHADLKGRRKVGHGEPLFIVDSSLASGTAFSVDILGFIRTLVLLP